MGGWTSVLQHLQGPHLGSILGAILGWGPCIYYNTFARARDRSFYVLEAPIWGPKWGHFGGPDWRPLGDPYSEGPDTRGWPKGASEGDVGSRGSGGLRGVANMGSRMGPIWGSQNGPFWGSDP